MDNTDFCKLCGQERQAHCNDNVFSVSCQNKTCGMYNMPHHETAWDTPTSELTRLKNENTRLKSVIVHQSELATHQAQKLECLAHNRKVKPIVLSKISLWLQQFSSKNKKKEHLFDKSSF